jgi:hypothetical protein
MITEFIEELSKELEGRIPKDDSGNYKLPLEEGVNIMMTSLPKGFSFFCSFAQTPKTNRDALLTSMLHGNLFGQGTRGAVLAISEDGNRLILSKIVDHATDYKEFKETLEDFINMVDYWRSEALKFK